MYIPKKYGQSKILRCPFCDKTAITQNKQKIPVCLKHKTRDLGAMKCACGKYLDLMSGKWGPYFLCMNCGTLNFKKALAMNPNLQVREVRNDFKPVYKIQNKNSHSDDRKTKRKTACKTQVKNKKEITITSDDLDYFY